MTLGTKSLTRFLSRTNGRSSKNRVIGFRKDRCKSDQLKRGVNVERFSLDNYYNQKVKSVKLRKLKKLRKQKEGNKKQIENRVKIKLARKFGIVKDGYTVIVKKELITKEYLRNRFATKWNVK